MVRRAYMTAPDAAQLATDVPICQSDDTNARSNSKQTLKATMEKAYDQRVVDDKPDEGGTKK